MDKILVTGACGFLGSHMVEQLVLKGHTVKAYVYYNSFNSWGWLETLDSHILSQVEVIPGDIRDAGLVNTAVEGVNGIIHLAALIAIPYSYHAPQSYIDTNITGTLNVLQSAKQREIDRILVTSTSEVYGTAKYVPIDEKHPLQGQSPYSASKIGADKVAESFYRSFDLPVTIVRPFNIYGPRQSARAIIPTIIVQLLEGMEEVRLGSVTPIRDFNYVLDTVEGFHQIYQKSMTIGQEINIASGVEITIEDTFRTIAEIINPNAKVICDENRIRPKNSEVNRLLGDNRLLKSLTDWQQKYTFRQGLEETVAWFRENKHRYKAELYNQ